MLTVQDIQAVRFEKVVFGGYDMKAVDEFLEQVTEDFAALQKENAALKAKMKVLVDKIEEYRSIEEGMRRALASAQNIAQETLDKSKAEAEQLMTRTRTEAEHQIDGYRRQIAAESKKLEDAKAHTASFVAQISAFYEDQLKGLLALSASEQLQPAQPQPQSQPTAPIIPEAAPKAEPVYEEPSPAAVEEPVEEPQRVKEPSKFKITEVTLGGSDKATADTVHFDFGNLKFGSDYKPEDEK